MALTPNIQNKEENYVEIFKEIKEFKDKLHRWATLLQFLAVFLPLTAIVLSAVIGSFASDLENFEIRILPFLAALLGFISSTFQVEKKAKDLRDAFRYLNYSLYLFVATDGDIKTLVEAYDKAESMVGHIQVSDKQVHDFIKNKQF